MNGADAAQYIVLYNTSRCTIHDVPPYIMLHHTQALLKSENGIVLHKHDSLVIWGGYNQ